MGALRYVDFQTMTRKQKSREALANSSVRGITAQRASKLSAKSQTPTKADTLKEKIAYEERLHKKIKPGQVYELTEEDCKNVVPCHIFVGGVRPPKPKSSR
jgi:hypothetical protein